jgi:hypothetical protein
MGLLFKVYTYLPIGASGILILMYGTTFIKVWKGSKYSFFIKLLVLLIVSNISQIPYSYSFYKLNTPPYITPPYINLPYIWITLRSISGFFLLASFNVSHWIFAFLYYKIARLMTFVLKEQVVPESVLKFDKTLNKIMFVLNIAFPFLN